MDSRLLPAGTAVLALLVLLPLGYQLYSSTALSPLGIAPPVSPSPPVATGDATALPPPAARAGGNAALDQLAPRPAINAPVAMPAAKPTPVPARMAANAALPELAVEQATPAPQVEAVLGDDKSLDAGQGAADPAPLASADAAALPAAAATGASIAAPVAAATPMSQARVLAPAAPPMAAPAATFNGSFGAGAFRAATVAPIAQPNGDVFQNFQESQQKAVATDPVSTFSIDVDSASYSYVRRALNEGRIPEPDAVRLEEMINYFPYDYPAATDPNVPFKPTISVFPTPWNRQTELMEIGIRGYEPPASARQPANLVFLIDTSGSMDEPDKLPLLQHALTLLVNSLSPDDQVSIVAYAGSAGVVLEPTKASDRMKILTALDKLEAGGSTAGAEGIELAYELAQQHKLANGNNRVILATDGDFNVGISDPDQLKQFIKQKRQAGIGLSVLGFGEGNLDDATMQALAQNGDGNASYIDSLSEAQKVLVKEAGSTLDTIAKDVKIQVEFNPATVASYRLLGYETRALNREDFNNDKVDAGDVGAGHTVTALYEITPAGADAVPPVDPLRYQPTPAAAAPGVPGNPVAPVADSGHSGELADFKLRYKLPGQDSSRLIEQPVTPAMVVKDIGQAPEDARWAAAVAAFGQKLKGSDYAGALSYGDIAQLARGARGADPDGYRAEFIKLVGIAGGLAGESATPPLPAPRPADPAPVPPIVS